MYSTESIILVDGIYGPNTLVKIRQINMELVIFVPVLLCEHIWIGYVYVLFPVIKYEFVLFYFFYTYIYCLQFYLFIAIECAEIYSRMD